MRQFAGNQKRVKRKIGGTDDEKRRRKHQKGSGRARGIAMGKKKEDRGSHSEANAIRRKEIRDVKLWGTCGKRVKNQTKGVKMRPKHYFR